MYFLCQHRPHPPPFWGVCVCVCFCAACSCFYFKELKCVTLLACGSGGWEGVAKIGIKNPLQLTSVCVCVRGWVLVCVGGGWGRTFYYCEWAKSENRNRNQTQISILECRTLRFLMPLLFCKVEHLCVGTAKQTSYAVYTQLFYLIFFIIIYNII